MLRLRSGDTLDLTAGIVRRVIAGRDYTMFGFNGQYPGPLLMLPQGAELTVRFRNALPMPTTVHWHGLRLDARFDGVPDLYQPAVEPGGAFTYTLRFPDGGIYWYHPHVREDVQQDLGLYGNIFVKPARADAYGPAHREEYLILDDLLLDEQGLVPWGRDLPTHALNGRFGNTMLVNGETGWRTSVRRGEVVRFFLTNASNTRTFNLGFGAGAKLKLVGSDLGNYAREAWVESVVIAPAERYVVDVRFERAGEVAMLNRVRAIDHLFARFFDEVDTLGTVAVGTAPASPDLAAPFATLRRGADAAELDSLLAAHAGKPPERTLELRVTFTGLPFVSERLMQADSAFFNPVEWAGTMPGMNWATTTSQASWRLHDPATGLDNMDVKWNFHVGDRVRLRLANVREVLHGMQHPIHLHGQRFLVLAVNGEPARNPVWKDTVLVPTGGSVDVLVEFSNPGRWMVHCHIAEHLQAGMMTVFDVEAP
jgi:FtsP/CotA-like multicopper oxidase with cupredoxin domain